MNIVYKSPHRSALNIESLIERYIVVLKVASKLVRNSKLYKDWEESLEVLGGSFADYQKRGAAWRRCHTIHEAIQRKFVFFISSIIKKELESTTLSDEMRKAILLDLVRLRQYAKATIFNSDLKKLYDLHCSFRDREI